MQGQIEVELDKVRSNPWQPRKAFDEQPLEALADSIRQHGVIQPIAVRRQGDAYEIIAGERRVLAARRAGLTKVPAILRTLDDSQMLLMALVENLQREDLNPVERARALRRLAVDFGKSHDEVARIAGLARSTVTNSIRILDLDEQSLAAVERGQISEGHARALLAEGDPQRRSSLLRRAVEENLNVRTVEIEASKHTLPRGSRTTSSSQDARRLAKILAEKLQTRVRIHEHGQRGRIVVHYSSLEEFERLFMAWTGFSPPVE
jgi:ParB family chromosome partitioning protein